MNTRLASWQLRQAVYLSVLKTSLEPNSVIEKKILQELSSLADSVYDGQFANGKAR